MEQSSVGDADWLSQYDFIPKKQSLAPSQFVIFPLVSAIARSLRAAALADVDRSPPKCNPLFFLRIPKFHENMFRTF